MIATLTFSIFIFVGKKIPAALALRDGSSMRLQHRLPPSLRNPRVKSLAPVLRLHLSSLWASDAQSQSPKCSEDAYPAVSWLESQFKQAPPSFVGVSFLQAWEELRAP